MADFSALADAFDPSAILKVAKAHQVDALITVGTDQPVYTISQVAEKLKLPMWLSSETGLAMTNKKVMKALFLANDIPTAPFVFMNLKSESIPFEGPYVVKPIDAQGQRGVFFCQSAEDVLRAIPKSLKFSRANEVLVEAFYPNEEVTVSGYVADGDVQIFTITDRITFQPDRHLGVCVAHQGPSKHVAAHGERLIAYTEKICSAFGLNQGPIYFQFLIGSQGVWVNEVASRIGGAYEDVTIPYATGIDILERNISDVLGENKKHEGYSYRKDHPCFSVELFFANPGKVVYRTPIDEMKKLPFVLDFGYNFEVDEMLLPISNASQRVGFAILTASSQEALSEHVHHFYQTLKMVSDKGESMVLNRGQ